MANGEGFDIPAGTIVLETAVDMDGLERDLERGVRPRAERAGERAGAGFGDGFRKKAGKEAVKGARQGLKKLGQDAEKSGKKVDEADSSLKEWSSTADEAAQTGAGLALIFSNRLASGLRGLKGMLVRSTSALVSWTAGGVRVAAEGLRGLGQEMRDSSNAMTQKFAPAVEVTGTALSGVAGLLSQAAQAVTALKLTVLGSSTALNVAAANEADNFEESWNRVLTLIPESVDGLDSLKREVSELGAEMGLTAETTNDTFYQVLSAMPQVAQNPREALGVLQAALETAATGFADGATAAKAITGVLNAFEMEADQAREVTDKLFAAQQQGVLTFQDIATEINKVSGITNALGGDFEDLLAIVSTMTGEFSARVPETFTQMRGLIRSIVDPSQEAAEAAKNMGEDFALSADLIREHGLVGAIERIVAVTEGSPEAISKIIPEANAQQLIISLAGRMGALEGRLNNINATGGLTKETLDEVNDSWARQKRIFSEQFKNDLRQIGFLYNDIRTNVLGAVNALRQMANQGDGGLAMILQGSRDAGFEMIDQAGQLGSRWERLTQEATEFTDSVLGIPPSMAEVEDRTRRVQRIMDVLERNGLEVAELFNLTNENADQWVDTLIESELALDDVEERVRRILRLQEMAGPTRDNFADQLTPQMAEVLGRDPAEMRGEPPEPIERPELPAQRSGEFQVAQVEARRARMQVEAFRDFLETGNEEAYQRRLESIQREVNELVADRVRLLHQHGAEAEEIQKLISLYDAAAERTDVLREQVRALAEQYGVSLEAIELFLERLEQVSQGEMPLPPGFESEEDLVGFADTEFASKVDVLDRRLEELEASGAGASEIFTEMQSLMDDLGVSVEDLQGSSLGLARIMVRKLGKVLPIWMGWADGAAEAADETEGLKQDLQEVSSFARGVLNVADALGVLGDDARKALRGVTDLVDALQQTAEEGESGFLGSGLTAGGLFGAVGAGVGIVSGITGFVDSLTSASEAERRERQRLAQEGSQLEESFRQLRREVEEVRNVFEQVSGDIITEVRRFLNEFETGSGTESDVVSRFLSQVDASGIPRDDFVTLLQGLPADFSELIGLLEGRFNAMRQAGEASFAGIIQEIEAAQQHIDELQLERAFESFQGQMDLLRQEFELMDIEDPIEQLSRLRELFLEFTDLPPGLQEQVAGADLSTSQGRRQFEAALESIFMNLQQLGPEAFGDLTLSQFREVLTEMEGTLEDAAGEDERGGRSEEFTRTRSITEVTGMRMVGILTTMDFRLAQIVRLLGGREGTVAPVPAPDRMVPARSRVAGGVSIGSVQSTVEGGITVQGAESPEETAAAVREDLATRVSEEIADRIIERLRAAGVLNASRPFRREA